MTTRRKTTTFAALALGAAMALSPVATGAPQAAKKKSVKIGDNFFSPKKMTVKTGTTVTWKWQSDNADLHNVKLKKGPKGVKKFRSEIAATDYSYKKKLSKKGTYSLVCTLHQEMSQKITVK